MGTGALEVAWSSKRLLGLEDFRDRIYNRLRDDFRELFQLTYGIDGVYETPIALSADGANEFQLSPHSKTTDGLGHVLQGNAELAEDIAFENANTIPYDVALHYAQRPRGVQVNPRTGVPEIGYYEDTVGEQGEPVSVTQVGLTLRFVIDNLCEAGVSHAGRKAVVWKKAPGVGATTEAVAIETLTVTWNGINNLITTVANFGQGASPSTVAADYFVTLLGPTVRRNTNLELTTGYAFIGRVTGAGAGNPPSVFSTAGQRLIDSSLADLNEITRIDAHGDVKVSVQADALDVGENQIEVKNFGGAVRFAVDENGNVSIAGNLTVQGTETVQNTETIVTNQIVGGNLNVGDADTDIHTVRGTWLHNAPGLTNLFRIDGATGRATFGDAVATLQRFRFRFNVATVSSDPLADNDASQVVVDNPNAANGVTASIALKLTAVSASDVGGMFVRRLSATEMTMGLSVHRSAIYNSPQLMFYADSANITNKRIRFGDRFTIGHAQPRSRFHFTGGTSAGLTNHLVYLDTGDSPATDVGFALTAPQMFGGGALRWGWGLDDASGDLIWVIDGETNANWATAGVMMRMFEAGASLVSAKPGLSIYTGRDFANPTTPEQVNTISGNKLIGAKGSILVAGGTPTLDTTGNNHFNIGTITDVGPGQVGVGFDVPLQLPYQVVAIATESAVAIACDVSAAKLTTSVTVDTHTINNTAPLTDNIDFDIVVFGKSNVAPAFP